MRTDVLSAVALATSSHALLSKRTYTLVAHHDCDASLNPDLIVQATISTCHAKCDAIGCWCFDHSSVDGDTTCRLSVGNAKATISSTSQLNSWSWDQAPPPSGSTPPSHYLPQWNSVSRHPNPSWFTDSKFGIYAHWGPFSVPAFSPGAPSGGTWYSKNMYQPGSDVNRHHVETYGDPATFGFKEFIPLLNGSGFDPKKWAALYRRAGAQYAGPVAAFADGFFMYDSKHTDYNAAKMGPQRDVVGEVVAAVRAEGLKVITSLHHSWLWTWYPTWNASLASDVADLKYQLTASHGGLYGPGVANMSENIPAQCYPYLSPAGGPYGPDNCSVTEGVVGAFATNQRFMGYWLDIAQEVAAKYKPDVMWFDSNMREVVDGAHRTRFLAGFYNDALAAKQEVVVTYKGQDMRAGAGVLDYERGGVGDIQSSVWQTDDSMDRSCWCWCNPLSLKPQTELIGELVDIVSKGGNLLLNAPPRTDGSFDERVVAPLLAIGRWLGASGAGIYKRDRQRSRRDHFTSGRRLLARTSGLLRPRTVRPCSCS